MKYEYQPLPLPTRDLVQKEIHRFSQINETIELALHDLINQYPRNTERHHVLLKVAAINQLYRTQIYAVEDVAKRISALAIDEELASGSLALVDKIAPVEVGGKVRYNFSFASKFCNWHRHDAYPIYDSLAELSLWSYGKQFQLDFDTKDRWEYIPSA